MISNVLAAASSAASTGGDPLFNNGLDWGVVGIVALKVLVTFAVLLVTVLFMVWFERKVISDMQNRIGPDRTGGKFGALQSLADGLKLFFKEDLLPDRADKRVFRLAPYLALVPAFLSFAIIPLGGTVHIFGHDTRLQLADPPVGILWLLVMSSIAVYGVMLAGWSSGSKYPLLGSVRASAQMVSYEAALGLAVATVVLVTGALETSQIVHAQSLPLNSSWPHWIHSWNLVKLAIVPFVIFVIAATAELNRPPFDLVEAESELVGGFNTEYSGIRFAMFFLAEFMNTVTMSAVIVTLFLGGTDGPIWHHHVEWVWPILWFVVKTAVFLYAYVWVRATLPRVRYDQLMDLGWKVLIPISLAWLLIIAAMEIKVSYGLFTFAGMLIAGVVLWNAMAVGRSTYAGSGSRDEYGAPPAVRATEDAPEEVLH
jgi:NADH-quinone oxidoreductase subunit H